MDFREATDDLFDQINHQKLATALGVSIASIRQARLSRGAAAHRAAPERWEEAVIQLAEERVEHYLALADRLREDARIRAKSPHLKRTRQRLQEHAGSMA
jgi:DNA-binding transcriptional MerR regulator